MHKVTQNLPIKTVEIAKNVSLSVAPRGTPRPDYLKPSLLDYFLGRPRTMFVLNRDFVVYINGIKYIVPEGYITDLASIPGPLRLWYHPTDPIVCNAATFHDRCYSHWYKGHLADGHWRYGVSKKFADNAFRAIMKHDGANKFETTTFHWGVKNFGRGGWAN